MHRSAPVRFGAFGLVLLLQVFVASSLLHPCCLGMEWGGVGHAGGHVHGAEVGHPQGAASEHGSAVPAHEDAASQLGSVAAHAQAASPHGHGPAAASAHASLHLADADLHHGSRPGVPAVHEAAVSQGHAHSPGGAHSGHHPHHDEGGCEGSCGFCCQTAGSLGLPSAPAVLVEAAASSVVGSVAAPSPVLRAPTSHLHPWANAPPLSDRRSV